VRNYLRKTGFNVPEKQDLTVQHNSHVRQHATKLLMQNFLV